MSGPSTKASEALAARQGNPVLRRRLASALYELAYSAAQDAVFVASAGGTDDHAGLTRVIRLDPHDLQPQLEIPLRQRGFGIALDDAASRLYVSHALDAAISVIDIDTNDVAAYIEVAKPIDMKGFEGEDIVRPPHNLRELVVDRANHRLFAPGLWIRESVLYVIDTRTLSVETVIPGLGYGAAGAALDAVSGKLFVSNLQGQVFRIDASSLELETTFEVAADQLLNLAFDEKRRRLLAVDQGVAHIDIVRTSVAGLTYESRGAGNRIVAIDPTNGNVQKSIPTGEGPVNLLIDHLRDRLYVTNRGSGTVTAYDLNDDDRLLLTVDLPLHPNSLALDERGGAVFVTIKAAQQQRVRDTESVARVDIEAAG